MSTQNALTELVMEVSKACSDASAMPIVAARLSFMLDGKGQETVITLNPDYTNTQYAEFLRAIAVNYDNGYGGQELRGTVWLEDKTWLERREYDGSEWWHHCKRPALPRGIGLEVVQE